MIPCRDEQRWDRSLGTEGLQDRAQPPCREICPRNLFRVSTGSSISEAVKGSFLGAKERRLGLCCSKARA